MTAVQEVRTETAVCSLRTLLGDEVVDLAERAVMRRLHVGAALPAGCERSHGLLEFLLAQEHLISADHAHRRAVGASAAAREDAATAWRRVDEVIAAYRADDAVRALARVAALLTHTKRTVRMDDLRAAVEGPS